MMNFKVFLLFGLVLFVCTENVKSIPVPDEKEEVKPEVEAAVAEQKKDEDEDDDTEEDISLSDLEEIKEFFEELQKGFDEIFKALKEAQEDASSIANDHSTTPKSEKK
ncbi:uncharacterized protein LOC127278060 isoform X2 [Leptopilina boulardi]|uniref:uncharacterized protein LOC127278060 isoform X2 n=1 Tax=Leptopilina boulardi TaxID=63433 RepID=UPI0021F57351|nr:uncharacterized protein LOC127278060 isoform X2 [Leptopilina boulardi]